MYQWQKEGVDIATETSNSLTLANVMISDEGIYTCLEGHSCNSILSDVATLEIIDPSSGFSVTDGIQNLQINNAQQTAIEFDPAVAGVTSSRTFIINNTGQTTITISNIMLTGDMVISLGPIPSHVDVGSSESFEVISESQVAGLFNASVIIESNIGSFTFPITVQFTDPPVNRALLVYNAVAPNGNGKHDFLKIENIESTANNSVQIFSRWGDKVYEASGYDNETTRFEVIGYVCSGG